MIIKIAFLFFLLIGNCAFNSVLAQNVEIEFQVEKDSVSQGEFIGIKWKTKNADEVFIIPFGMVKNNGEKKFKIKENTTLILLAENSIEQKVVKKQLWVTSKTKGTEPAEDNEYIYPIKGFVNNSSLLKFSNKLETCLQDKLQFSLFATGSTNSNTIAVKTNLSDRDYLLNEQDLKNKINKKRISYMVSYVMDIENKNQVNFTIRAIIEKKKKIKLTYSKVNDENLYHKEIIKLKSLLGN